MAEKGKKREKIEEKGVAPEGGALFLCAHMVRVVFAVVTKRYNKYNKIVSFYYKKQVWEKH